VSAPRDDLRALVAALSDEEAARLVEILRDPMSRAAALAPYDDEGELRPEFVAELDAARAEALGGEVRDAADVYRDLGLEP
jgi:hypothetical protein